MSSCNLIGGFRGAGLWPLNQLAVRSDRSKSNGEDNSKKILRDTIVNAKSRVVEEEQETNSSNSRKKRVPTSPKSNVKSSDSDNDDDTKC